MATQLHNYTFVNDYGMALVVPVYTSPNQLTDAEADAWSLAELAEVVKIADDWWLDNIECAVCDKAQHNMKAGN